MFFKWFFKAAVAIYLVTHTFDIVMAVFDIGQNVVSGAAGVIHGNTSIDIDATIAQMRTGMENMGVGELLGLSIETLLISLCLKIMAILITVILYGRMIEIYCTVSIAPIPIATMSNREWGSIGTNYLKGLFALAFQGFLIMVCVGIYAVLINGMIIADNIHSALFSVAAYTVILCFSLFKTGSLAKSIFHAQPGDLIFFVGTYDTPGVSHVGIYVGDGVMIHCGDPIQYTSINSSYWQQHFYAFGRPAY